jgi:NADP-dependent 3-hydroxy acid dehydrogenase YdfG
MVDSRGGLLGEHGMDEPMSASQKVILLTGCSSGIGRALSLELARRGCRVFGSARDPSTLHELAALGGQTLALDVTDSASIARAVESVVREAGRIDILINNAGQNLIGPLAEVPLAAVSRMLETNVQGLLAVTQAVFPHMAKARRGTIVNIGSVVGLLPTPFAGAYCATKAAVHMLSEVLRMEAAPFGIDVVVVQPGGVTSKIADTGSADLARYEHTESLYYPVRAGIAKRARASQERAQSAEDFARHVASALLVEKPPRIIRGGRGAHLYPALSRMPSTMRARMLSRVFELNRLR